MRPFVRFSPTSAWEVQVSPVQSHFFRFQIGWKLYMEISTFFSFNVNSKYILSYLGAGWFRGEIDQLSVIYALLSEKVRPS